MSWARQFLLRVADARVALEREQRAAASRREALYSVGSPSVGSVHGGVSDPMAKVDAVLDREAEDDGLDWARTTMATFGELLHEVRSSCTGELVSASYAVEWRYGLGLSEREAAHEMGLAPSTVRRLIATLVDYLDHVGPGIVDGEVMA